MSFVSFAPVFICAKLWFDVKTGEYATDEDDDDEVGSVLTGDEVAIEVFDLPETGDVLSPTEVDTNKIAHKFKEVTRNRNMKVQSNHKISEVKKLDKIKVGTLTQVCRNVMLVVYKRRVGPLLEFCVLSWVSLFGKHMKA